MRKSALWPRSRVGQLGRCLMLGGALVVSLMLGLDGSVQAGPRPGIGASMTAGAGVTARPSLSFYGMPGLVDMPVASPMQDAVLGMSAGYFTGQLRASLAFQITPRLSGAFRYSKIDGYRPELGHAAYYDHSFDIQYLLMEERRIWPALAVGLRDFGGTGIYSAEYLVATKHLWPRLSFTGGLGWGRLGSYKGFANPLGLGPRPAGLNGLGGKLDLNKWFRGDAAFFGGVEWRPADWLSLFAEYSSDTYATEVAAGLFSHNSPLNFGIKYNVSPHWTLGGYYMYGSVLGMTASYQVNLRDAPSRSRYAQAPVPVRPRPDRWITPQAWGKGWLGDDARRWRIKRETAALLAQQGLTLEALEMTGTRAVLRLENPTYAFAPQAIGRAARVLSQTMPASVDIFTIVPVVNGIAAAKITIRRSYLERLEFDPGGTPLMLAAITLDDGAGPTPRAAFGKDRYPRISWGLSPYFALGLFDPDHPVRADLGAEMSARFDISPGLVLSGALRRRGVGNRDSATQVSNSVLPHVRTDYRLYDNPAGPTIDYLTLDYFFRAGRNIYGRVSAGYLERMFGGVSVELLWKPVNSRFALGAELNYVRQRNFDQRLGFQDYGITMGRASAYYDFGGGFHGQLDLGRYLAGDWGATVSLDREFDNGVRIGAFFTLTNLSAAQFGEGSFDKGVHISIPINWVTGHPTRKTANIVVRPTTRDGGAQLAVPNRLYELVRGYQNPHLRRQQGMFWK